MGKHQSAGLLFTYMVNLTLSFNCKDLAATGIIIMIMQMWRDARYLIRESEVGMAVSKVVQLIGGQIVQIVTLASIALFIFGSEEEEHGNCREPAEPDQP